MKGSRTVSPTNENMRTRRYANSTGNGAGWCRVDSPVMSDQKPEPFRVLILREHGRLALLAGRLAIAARFPEHQNVLHVVFQDGVRLVGLPQKRGTVLHFVVGVGDLVPEDRSEVIEAHATGAHADIRVQGHDHVPPLISSPGYANIAHHAYDAAPRNQNSVAMAPYLGEFIVELLVIADQAELVFIRGVFLQGPVRRRRDDQMHGVVWNPVEATASP